MSTLAYTVSDSTTMLRRDLRRLLRYPSLTLLLVGMPIVFLLLFVYVFGGQLSNGLGTENVAGHTGRAGYLNYITPGVLLMTIAAAVQGTAIVVAMDMTGGIIDRFRSMDIGGPAVLTGHVVASVTRNLLSTVLVLAVAFLIGFRPHADAAQWLAALGVLLVFVVAFSWLSAAIGLLARSPEAANGFSFFVTFLPYPSSAFVPIDTMPSWLHGFAEHQPFTPVIESMRGLLLDTPVGNAPWLALAWCGGILAVAVTASGFLFRRRTS
jgi:ABC-2 type transport system permease protein